MPTIVSQKPSPLSPIKPSLASYTANFLAPTAFHEPEDDTSTLHELFRQQVRRTPLAIAVVDGAQRITYQELDHLSSLLATYLRSLGVTVDSVVGICMERCAEYIIAILATLKAGGAYCPLEIAYPREQLTSVAEDVRAVTVLTKRSFENLLPNSQRRFCMDVDTLALGGSENGHIDGAAHGKSGARIEPVRAKENTYPSAAWIARVQRLMTDEDMKKFARNEIEPDLNSLCYVVYSSGTTGKPKGIRCFHAGPVYSYLWRQEFAEKDCTRVAHNIYLVWECIRPLIRGATSYIIPDNVIYDPFALVNYIEREEIEQTLFTPSLMETLLNTIDVETLRVKLSSLRCLWLNGEVVTAILRERLLNALPHVKSYNLYSISECADVAVLDLTTPWDPSYKSRVAPVGHPMKHSTIYLFDPDMNPVPYGESGELYIGGKCLARDYLDRPDLTEARFPSHPTDPSLRLYRTGDKARFLPNGALEILGRVDLMVVRIRGNFIQIGCVESAIHRYLNVKSCVVAAHGEEGDDKRLVAYLIPEDNSKTQSTTDTSSQERLSEFSINPATGTSHAIRAHLARHIPQYMIPSVYLLVENFPTNPSTGKVNLGALPAPPHRIGTTNWDVNEIVKFLMWVSPDDSLDLKERAITMLFENVLNLDHGSIDSATADFFDLGGHSLAAARLIAAIKRLYGSSSINMPDLFTNSAVNKLAVVVDMNCRSAQCDELLDADKALATDSSGYAINGKETLLETIRREAKLPPEIRIDGNNFVDITSLREARSIFMTGATGFVGSFLLWELLCNTTATITCLIRPSSSDPTLSPFEILTRSLHKYSINYSPSTVEKRVVALQGDLSLPKFGLTREQWIGVAETTDVLFHAGAIVNLFFPYPAISKANVAGTLEVLRLAVSGGRTKHVCHVSTNAVCPSTRKRCRESDELSDVLELLDSGYAQSKWAAEQLIFQAKQRGIPASVFRLGNVSGHSVTGASNVDDFQFLLLSGSVHVGTYPIIKNWSFEWTPVDFVTKSLCHITDEAIRRVARRPKTTANGFGDTVMTMSNQTGIYHLVNPNGIDSSLMFDWLISRGYRMRPVPFETWVKLLSNAFTETSEMSSQQERDPRLKFVARLGGLVYSLETKGEEFLTRMPKFDNVMFEDALEERIEGADGEGHAKEAAEKLDRPSLGTGQLNAYLNYLSSDRVGMFPASSDGSSPSTEQAVSASTSNTEGKLSGKVAIVTGASSGIGAAIARALASEGCAVSLAARRSEKLKEVRSTFPPGSRIMWECTDVTRREQVKELAARTEEMFGRPADILVNAAGVMYFTLMKNLCEDDWERTIDVCVKGTLNGIGAVLKPMLDRGSGIIVNISSDAGRKVFPGLTVYSGAKFAVEAISQGLRIETANTGLKVVSIQPGNVATELLSLSTDQEGLATYGTPSGAKVLDPEDVASAVLYAVTQPEHVAVNEVLIEPREEPA